MAKPPPSPPIPEEFVCHECDRRCKKKDFGRFIYSKKHFAKNGTWPIFCKTCM